MRVFDGLNEAQSRAVVARDPAVLVVAGPGTGKTLTIVRRIGYLIDQGVPPDQILALTFSNRAAREMRERVEAFLGDSSTHVFIGTFHLFGLRSLRQIQPKTLCVCTRDSQTDLIESITGKGPKSARQMAERISKIKNEVEILDDEIRPIYGAYEDALAERGEWDFDDLIRIPAELFRTGRMAGKYGGYAHIVVDEYQDVSPMQYRLLRSLSAAASANVWAVGDPDQAIYAFRGADIANFRNFERDFAPIRLVVLEENYRSSQAIVEAGNAVIANNQERIAKELVTSRKHGGLIDVISVPDERAEADAIAREIESRMGGTSHYRITSGDNSRDYAENDYGFSDFAVLFRTNAQVKTVREALGSWGIPIQVIGRKERVLEAFIDQLRLKAEDLEEGQDIVPLIASVCEETGIDETDRMILEGIAASYRDEAPRDAAFAVIDELTLSADQDSYDTKADKVALMTMHSAKGLEFRMVFVAGCCDGWIPYTKTNEASEIEEERRLFYVALTRAKENLFILCPRHYSLYGQRIAPSESIFLSEIPQSLVRSVRIPDPSKKTAKGKQHSLF